MFSFFFPFFLSGSRGCSWKTMLKRTFGRLNECGWRLRCSQILGRGCLLSHKGGGRIQRVFLKLDWLQIADFFTFFIMYITVDVLNFDNPPHQNRPWSGSLVTSTIYQRCVHSFSFHLPFTCSIVVFLHSDFWMVRFLHRLLFYPPCKRETVANSSHVCFKIHFPNNQKQRHLPMGWYGILLIFLIYMIDYKVVVQLFSWAMTWPYPRGIINPSRQKRFKCRF